MAKPSTVVSWATDTNFSTSPAAGENGTPTKATPSSGYIAEGYVPGKNWIGQYTNYLLNLIGQWIAYLNLSGTDELTYAAGRNFTRDWHLGRGQLSPADIYPDGRTKSGIGVDGALQIVHDASIDPSVTSSVWREPLAPLPLGVSFTKLEVFCQPNGQGTMAATLWKRTRTTTTQVGSTDTTAGAVTGELLEITMTETIAADANYFLEITTNGSDVGGPVTAEVRYMILSWTSSRATGLY